MCVCGGGEGGLARGARKESRPTPDETTRLEVEVSCTEKRLPAI